MPPSIALAASRALKPATNAVCGMALALAVAMAFAPARADTYPSKPVRIIVPYGPGGIADVTMRLVAQNLSQHFGQQFFIENRPGAGGVVGMQAAREAPADGYTLVMVGGGLTIAKALFKSLPYNIETDFTPISTTASYGLVIATKAGSPYKTINDVIAAAKAHPGTLNFGTINAGSAQIFQRSCSGPLPDLTSRSFPTRRHPTWRTRFCAVTSTSRSNTTSVSSRPSPMARWLSLPPPGASARATCPTFQPWSKAALPATK